MKMFIASAGTAFVIYAIGQSLDASSVGWAAAGICASVYLAGWAITEQLEKGLNKMDELLRVTRLAHGVTAMWDDEGNEL